MFLKMRFTLAAVAGAVMSLTNTAIAQEASESLEEQAFQGDRYTLEELIVTARQRTETIQDIPLSVHALTADQIERRGINQLSDVILSAPGVAINSSGSISTNAVVIRGLNQAGGIGQDTNVAVFVDGVYISGRDAAFMPMMGVERVEVVRGPQSALYGRNAFAGAINYITKKPSDEFESQLEVTGGADGQRGLKARLSGQLSENFFASIDAQDSESGSSFEDEKSGKYLGSLENKSARASFIWMPSENAEFDLSLTHLDIHEQPQAGTELAPNAWRRVQGVVPFPAPAFTISGNQRFAGTIRAAEPTGVIAEAEGTTIQADRASLTIDWNLGDHALTAITGYNSSESRAVTGYDSVYTGDYYFAAPAVLAGAFGGVSRAPGTGSVNNITNLLPARVQSILTSIPAGPGGIALWQATDLNYQALGGQPNHDREEISQEFRIASDYDGSSFNWMAGISYDDLELNEWLWLSTLNPGDALSQFLFDADLMHAEYGGGDPLVLTETKYNTTTQSVFFSAEYMPTDKLALTLEGRYTDEEKEARDTANNLISPTLANAGFSPALSDFKDNWSYFSPRLTVSYKPDEYTMFYGNIAQGTKSGGFNGGSVDSESVYEEETNTTFEIGAKRTVLDGRGYMNITAYYIDWDDQQVRDFSSVAGVGVPRVIVANLGETEVKGVEIETAFQINDSWSFHLGYTYNDSEIKSGVVASDAGFTDFAALGLNGVEDGCGFLGLRSANPGGVCGAGVFLPFPPPGRFVVAPGPNPAVSDGDTSGNQSPNTHKHTLNAGLRLSTSLNNGLELYTNTEVVWKDQHYLDASNTLLIEDSLDVNFQVGLNGERWYAKVNISNLFEDDTPTSAYRPGLWDGSFQSTLINRNERMVSLSIGYKL